MKKKLLFMIVSIILLSVNFIACGKSNVITNEHATNSKVIDNELNDENNLKTNLETICPYIMLVNGIEHKFPMSYEDFLDKGWELADFYISNGTTAVKAGESWTLAADYSNNVEFSTEGVEGIKLTYRNSTDKELKLKECKLVGIFYDETLVENFKLSQDIIKFSNGTSTISIGSSTINDVQSAFGEPNNIIKYEDDEMTKFVDETETSYIYIPEDKEWMLSITFDKNGISKYFSYYGEY